MPVIYDPRTARSLLGSSAQPDEAEIRAALSGNLCRCTGYVRIVEAVLQAARQLAANGQEVAQ
jgi:carbon-monoxide dehydrogenase small subunit